MTPITAVTPVRAEMPATSISQAGKAGTTVTAATAKTPSTGGQMQAEEG